MGWCWLSCSITIACAFAIVLEMSDHLCKHLEYQIEIHYLYQEIYLKRPGCNFFKA